MEKDDVQLIIAYQKGDVRALDELIYKYTGSVYGFVRKLIRVSTEAEDITQETFIKMWKKLAQYDARYNFKTWLFTIARNSTIDYLRKQKSVVFSDLSDGESLNFEDTLFDTSPLPDDLFDDKRQREKLSIAIDKLSIQHKTVVLLKHEQDFTFEEIAKILHIPMNTAKGQYYRAIQALKKDIDGTMSQII